MNYLNEFYAERDIFIRVSKEADKGETPYNLRNCAYLEEFLQPKIVYREISTVMEAAIAPAGWYINNKLYMITGCGDAIEYVCCFLNSKLFTKAILCNANFGGGKGIDFLGQIKLPKFNTIVYGTKTTYDDNYFCNLFGLNADEQRFILSE